MSDAMSDLEWEEREERMDIISQNGPEGTHYRDMVNHPQHYQVFPDEEVDQLARKVLTKEELQGAYKYMILKYRLRAGFKGDILEDIDKSHVYREWLFDLQGHDA